MSDFLKNLLKDKTNRYSLREVIIAISMLLIILSWIAQVIFGLNIPEFMFYSLISLIAAGCFGYSIERHTKNTNKWKE